MKDVLTPTMIFAIAVVLLLVTGIGATVLPAYAPEPAQLQSDPALSGLSGVWKSNDGGTYYLSQIGDILWWIGMSGGNDGRTYSNVFKVTIDQRTIAGEWADVPRGTNRNAGTMTLKMESDGTLLKISQTGGFGPILWQRVWWGYGAFPG